MATTTTRVSSHTILMLTVGLFFVTLGITGIIPEAGESIFSLSINFTTLEIIFGVLEILCGLFFVFDAFRRVPNKLSSIICFVILLLWLARFVITQVVKGLDFNSSGVVFHPTFWGWLLTSVTELLVAGSIWTLLKDE